ncbi:MAG: TlyA family RNA methyltransferase [Clostridia bacterium]|nr:TlyA family RNA methyltransferase [Clostridia bacterium]
MRIDKYLAEEFGSRNRVQTAIDKGLILVNGKRVAASYEVGDEDNIEILTAEESFVSAGGYKLSKALKDFKVSVKGQIFADIGASTGGFTDCLLQNGAHKVYCIDVGESQLDESLKNKNVIIIDGFNARNLNRALFEEELDGAVIDVSFISLTYILKSVADVLEDGCSVFALIKPQFECESRNVGKNGIVKDKKVRLKIIEKICLFANFVRLAPQMLTSAPIIKGKNVEYIIFLKKGAKPADIKFLLKSIVN